MTSRNNYFGVAALATCESLLISMTEKGLISKVESQNILSDAIAALESEMKYKYRSSGYSLAINTLKKMQDGTNGVRRATRKLK